MLLSGVRTHMRCCAITHPENLADGTSNDFCDVSCPLAWLLYSVFVAGWLALVEDLRELLSVAKDLVTQQV